MGLIVTGTKYPAVVIMWSGQEMTKTSPDNEAQLDRVVLSGTPAPQPHILWSDRPTHVAVCATVCFYMAFGTTLKRRRCSCAGVFLLACTLLREAPRW